jgi:hypothetical protein
VFKERLYVTSSGAGLSTEGDWDRYRWNNVAALYEAPTRVELNLAYSVHTTWVFVSSLSPLVLY